MKLVKTCVAATLVQIATKKKLIALVNVRGWCEVASRSTAQARLIFVSVGFPVPTVSLQP
jgi:hypothetical protein